ncbi:prepilin-type N-terminal cleavage/methylation domain-containing protein [Nocardioides ginsengisoli]|uniref:Type II secretion system protein n=1 Tax=Nocardioides ginsengisoli TaxID=363868 RepID=A0ABW3W505_9ACTN
MDLRGRLRTGSDRGETLVEVLAAVVILGIAGVAIVAGLMLSVQASDIHRKESTGGAYVRSYAEAIEKYLNTTAHYVKCAGSGDYSLSDIGFAAPTGYTASHTAATVLAGDGSAVTTGSCPSRDTGVQRLTLTVASNDGRASERLTIVVRRDCGTGTSCD